jgi:hypothetical protein
MHGGAISRRIFVAGAVTATAPAARLAKPVAYSFATADYDVRVTVEFYDRYSTDGFSFRDLSRGRGFCLSASGEENRQCASAFFGSLAVARYKFRPRLDGRRVSGLREHVRTIDLDPRLPHRIPFDHSIEVRDGIASDIQAFGYESPPPGFDRARKPGPPPPWYYFRQDLYIDASATAFLVVHWRHTAAAIRILDVIAGEGTWPLDGIR